MAEENPNPNSSNPNPTSPSLLSTLGEEIIRIVTPVSICMLLVVLLVTTLSYSSHPISSISTMAFSESDSDSLWTKLSDALLYSLFFVVTVTLLTFLIVVLFYFRFTAFLKYYMAFSSFIVLAFLGGEISLLLVSHFNLAIDVITFSFLLVNFSVIGVLAVFLSKMPISVTQVYLVVIGVLVAYWFTMLPEWTTWAVLIAMSLYDLAAVLLPGGPLRLLVELAISRNEELPALVYEARPVDPQPESRRGLWRSSVERRDLGSGSEVGEVVLPETSLVVVEEVRAPLLREEEEEDVDGIGLASSGAIKLGLGDFIFYSVLVGRAALYDFTTVYACYLAIIAGLGITLLLLTFYRKALPALPFSVMLGILFYFLTRELLEVFVVQCSTNLLMF